MKSKLVNLKIELNADSIMNLLMVYINKNYWDHMDLLDCVRKFSDEEYDAFNILEHYNANYDKQEFDDEDSFIPSHPDSEWVECEIFSTKYIISYYPEDFSWYKFTEKYELMKQYDASYLFYAYKGM